MHENYAKQAEIAQNLVEIAEIALELLKIERGPYPRERNSCTFMGNEL